MGLLGSFGDRYWLFGQGPYGSFGHKVGKGGTVGAMREGGVMDPE